MWCRRYVYNNTGLCGDLIHVGNVGTKYSCYGGCDGLGGTALNTTCPSPPPPAAASVPLVAGGAGGGALLLAAVAFFMYRRRAKRQLDCVGALPDFTSNKPQQTDAPVYTPSPLFLTPAVRSRPTSQFGLNVGPQLWEYGYVAVCARLA